MGLLNDIPVARGAAQAIARLVAFMRRRRPTGPRPAGADPDASSREATAPSPSGGRDPGLWRLLGAWIALTATGALGNPVSREYESEYDLKAVYLYNLACFVQWPESAFAGPDDPFVIGILGVDPFGVVLEEIVAREYVGRRRFALRRFRRPGEIDSCHLLFISASEASRLSDIFARLEGRPVLTVGDVPSFAENGGMIGIARARDQLQLHVNPAAVQRAALTVSSKLLEVSHVVGDSVAVHP